MVLVTVGLLAAGWFANRFHQREQIMTVVRRNEGDVQFAAPRNLLSRSITRLPLPGLRQELLGDVEELALVYATLSDADLSILRYCPRLKRLDLDYSQFDCANLAHWPPLPQLAWLDLQNTQVTDESMNYLVRFDGLTSLILDENPITDAAIPQITQLSNLRYLRVRQTRISKEGLAQLQRALPDCRVVP
jgi:hypothetical protein